ncbi:MAG: helix-turn-helix transcriptional regulator [Dysgonamonadaceae bacterium]|jgi:transcriptional regulator with XRE-family HTH domain|nr:helix-turn-helix transcriptional regulator [Dysgonamonadaceae bacterium]
MKDRIKQIIDGENIPPAKFADRLQINRAVISHILNGRNNPSLDVVSKILSEMKHINPEWLINGVGDMYKEGFVAESLPQENDLFSKNATKLDNPPEKSKYAPENELNTSVNRQENSENEPIAPIIRADKKITQIIIYYNDNTFECFTPHPVKG